MRREAWRYRSTPQPEFRGEMFFNKATFDFLRSFFPSTKRRIIYRASDLWIVLVILHLDFRGVSWHTWNKICHEVGTRDGNSGFNGPEPFSGR